MSLGHLKTDSNWSTPNILNSLPNKYECKNDFTENIMKQYWTIYIPIFHSFFFQNSNQIQFVFPQTLHETRSERHDTKYLAQNVFIEKLRHT